MRIEHYYGNIQKINGSYDEYVQKKVLLKEAFAPALIFAHLDKAKHNIKFVNKNMQEQEFNDWTFVALYYAIYHASLSLLAKKGYVSKNHTATLIFLLKEYSIPKEDIELIEELAITKNDAELYTSLKSKREQASYSTNIAFKDSKIQEYKEKVIDFINKVEDILETD